MDGWSRDGSTFGVWLRVRFFFLLAHALSLSLSLPLALSWLAGAQLLRLTSLSCDGGIGSFGLVVPVDNEAHCDFRKLRSLLIRTHMLDLIHTTEEGHYETYRQAQMETRKFGEAKVRKVDNPKFKEEEEGLRKRFTEQVKLEEARFRQWEQHVRFSFSLSPSPHFPLLP